MCSIFGAILNPKTNYETIQCRTAMTTIMERSTQRGRDGYGFVHTHEKSMLNDIVHEVGPFDVESLRVPDIALGHSRVVGNFRAEPTTEFVEIKEKFDQQPYCANGWVVAHNGTIANDVELRTNQLETQIDSAAIPECMKMMPRNANWRQVFEEFKRGIQSLKGSYAILAINNRAETAMYVAANYRPVWYTVTESGVFFASSAAYLEDTYENAVPQMLAPYTVACFNHFGIMHTESLYGGTGKRALVVCSGGLDSVTAACAAKANGYSVELVHFVYGCRAEQHEVEAVHAVAEYMDVPLHVIPMHVYDPKDSPLLRKDEKIAGGETGAEFAHEWVPARNLVMLSYATAFAEANGFDTIALGNNLEEAGAYPDNEPEFINRFNALLPFAVRDGFKLEVIQPVGNLMKHEIVALGHEVGAPLHLTWSCYKHGEQHCGQCGPCFMRKTAFEINGLEEVITYESDCE
ncbi:putative QueC-like protein [Vibrio phage vB_VpS_BA3]|nr:putative QueC-like protein [Vibrio phage vB_VpS_BA3]